MAHIQYMPGDPRLVDQLVYELKSKGIFDQFRKDCIADVDTRPAYQNLRQRVESSVSTFLSRQTWQPDLNKNQLREKLRKHILEGNYLEQGLERIVDQVVNPKVASVFIPKVEDLVYNYLGITRKKSIPAETSNGKIEDLLPNDLEAVSPGSVKSNDDKNESMDVDQKENEMEVEEENPKCQEKEDKVNDITEIEKMEDIQLPSNGPNEDIDKNNIPLPSEEIKPENIPSPDTSPPKVELEKIELPKEPIISTDIPLPDDVIKEDKDHFFKPINSDEDDSSSDSSLRRNMSPLTPIRNFNNENSYDAQQAFENDSVENKNEENKEPSSFRFTIEAKLHENSCETIKTEKKQTDVNLSYQFNTQVNINNFNTPLYEDSSNSNNLQIDYESDANSKVNMENKVIETDQNSEDSKKERKPEEKKSSSSSSHKSSHRSRDSHKHSSNKDKRSDSKHSSSRDSSKHDKSKSSKDESKSKSSDKDKSKDKNEKKEKDSSRDSSRHRSSHKSSHKDPKSHRSSSSSGKHSSKHSDDKKTSSSSQKEKTIEKSSEKSRDSKSSSHRSDKDKKSSSSSSSKGDKNSKTKPVDKDKKSKKESDDHYSLSGRGNPNRRSTDRDSNDGSSSSKGSHNPSCSKSSNSKKDSKSSSKSESTSTSGESTSPSDKENVVNDHYTKYKETLQHKPIVRIDGHLEMPVVSPPRLPFVPDVTIRKPKIAANFEEAKRLMKMRKFLDEEQKRMNQEAALLLEFQANVRPSLSQVYSSIPGPELEFACVTNVSHPQEMVVKSNDNINHTLPETLVQESLYTNNELLTVLNDAKDKEDISDVQNNGPNKIANNTNKDSISGPEEPILPKAKSETRVEYSDKHAELRSNECKVGFDENLLEEHLPLIDKQSKKHNHIGIEKQLELFEVTKDDKETNIPKETKQPGHKDRSNHFEVTVITEALSESEDVIADQVVKSQTLIDTCNKEVSLNNENITEPISNNENNLFYFGEHEKYNAELERARFCNFFKDYTQKSSLGNKIYLINCNTYEENIFRELSKDFGEFEIVNYCRNGHLKLPKTKNVIKNVNISTEISLPIDNDYINEPEIISSHHVFSPDKSDCSFELSSDYDAKLEEMVNKTSRQEIMEIILGNVVDSSPSKMPRIDYLTDSNIDSEYENNLKRKMCDVETTVNNNRHVLTPNKIRKLSTEQITSTTTENEEIPNNKSQNITRSKYLGKAKRVGLPRPRRSLLTNSPSSDKSVENYEQSSPASPVAPNGAPNGALRRSAVQRYNTADLYKPKLHYLSRRNHVS